MQEKRKHPRHACYLKSKLAIYFGDPTTPDILSSKPEKAKGRILDISASGAFIVSNAKTGVGSPISVAFKTNKKVVVLPGTIVRAGTLKNNPSEFLKKFKISEVKEEAYLAVNFNELIVDIDPQELLHI